MPPTKRWLLDKYVPMMQDCWACCFCSKAKDRHVHRLLVSRSVTNTTSKSRLRVDIIDWLDFTFARSTRSIDSIDFKVYASWSWLVINRQTDRHRHIHICWPVNIVNKRPRLTLCKVCVANSDAAEFFSHSHRFSIPGTSSSRTFRPNLHIYIYVN